MGHSQPHGHVLYLAGAIHTPCPLPLRHPGTTRHTSPSQGVHPVAMCLGRHSPRWQGAWPQGAMQGAGRGAHPTHGHVLQPVGSSCAHLPAPLAALCGNMPPPPTRPCASPRHVVASHAPMMASHTPTRPVPVPCRGEQSMALPTLAPTSTLPLPSVCP